jgi:hypothetical protein
MEDGNMKRCTKCLEVKDESEFGKKSSVSSKLQPRCKACVNIAHRLHSQQNRVACRERDRERYRQKRLAGVITAMERDALVEGLPATAGLARFIREKRERAKLRLVAQGHDCQGYNLHMKEEHHAG